MDAGIALILAAIVLVAICTVVGLIWDTIEEGKKR